MFGRSSDTSTLDLPPYVVLRHSKRARRLALRLDPKERVFHLVLPPRTSMRSAQRFAEEHDAWMMDALDALPAPITFNHGRVLPILGRDHRIEITQDLTLKRTSITLEDNKICVRTNKDDPTSRITRHLKTFVKNELRILAAQKAARIGKNIESISVRDTKSRWGSCSSDGNLSFSWRLIFAPYASFDYVVAHEVAHLQHLDHSRAFWNVCRDLSEDYVEGEYWMREHGHELMRYGG